MKRVLVVLITLALCGNCASHPVASTTDAPDETGPPNILLLVADDLGFLDLGFLGSEIRTPHLDELARSGLVLTNFLASPNCSPTRAMLLSGTDAHPAGLGSMSGDADANQAGKPGYEGVLSHRVVTVARLLADAGYDTQMAGKWHLGMAPHQRPHMRGFERCFALLPAGASHFSDARWLVDYPPPARYQEDGEDVALPEDFFSSDHYTDKLIEYMQASLEAEEPFFSYAAYTAPHWPLQAPEAYIDRYAGVYDEGWDVLRRRRFEAARAAGLATVEQEMPERVRFAPAWESLTADERAVAAREMEIYAAMVENLDANIGRLLAFLREKGELENTFVLFMSDNGPEGNPIDRLAGVGDWIERAHDNSLENMGRRGSYVFYGPGWAQAGVAPFRLFKAFPTQGGVRVPVIVSGPGIARGERSDAFVTVKDVTPTLLELAGTEHPGHVSGGRYGKRRVMPMQGSSMLAFLRGERDAVHAGGGQMGWELFGRRAFQSGSWKVLWLYEPYGPGRWELFDLATDPAESRDLAAEEPEKLAELLTLWRGYARRNRVVLPTRDMGYAIEPR